ncbi:MAG: hypothetical protein HY873_01405 [Chloroflexi bacterium]|nr:hypothetical protein [Chloroflexota bacterium]
MVTRRTPAKPARKPSARKPKAASRLDPMLWEDITALFADVRKEDWRKLPKDGARRFDEYIEDMGR